MTHQAGVRGITPHIATDACSPGQRAQACVLHVYMDQMLSDGGLVMGAFVS
jgi:hypothetical protein